MHGQGVLMDRVHGWIGCMDGQDVLMDTMYGWIER